MIDLAGVWDRTRDAIEVPPPSVFERLLRAAGLPAHDARLVAVASAFRGVWLTCAAAVLAFAALAAAMGHARGVWLFLVVAPVMPCLVVAAGYDPWMDPALEPERVVRSETSASQAQLTAMAKRSGLTQVDAARTTATKPTAGSSQANAVSPGTTSPKSSTAGNASASTAIVRSRTSRSAG